MNESTHELDQITRSAARAELESALMTWLPNQRWFGGKSRRIVGLSVGQLAPVEARSGLAFTEVSYTDGEQEVYLLALALGVPPAGRAIFASREFSVYDPMDDESFASALLRMIIAGGRIISPDGELVAWPTGKPEAINAAELARLRPRRLSAEQSNSSIQFGDRYVLKLFRRVTEGVNPDLEVSSYLTTVAHFSQTPAMVGGMEFRRAGRPPRAVGILQRFVANQGDAWSFTLGVLRSKFDQLANRGVFVAPKTDAAQTDAELMASPSLIELGREPIPSDAAEIVADYLPWAELLGRRTGEMHRALGGAGTNGDFRPEPLDGASLTSLAQQARELLRRACATLAKRAGELSPADASLARKALASEQSLADRFDSLTHAADLGHKIRCHGDYHLGQLLFTGDDFVILDFEGEPTRSLAERRTKQCPLKDVAGMLRSFDYARHVALRERKSDDRAIQVGLADCSAIWWKYISAVFLRSYLSAVDGAQLLPRESATLECLLDAYLLEKAIYELDYELNNRPTWVGIPLAAMAAVSN